MRTSLLNQNRDSKATIPQVRLKTSLSSELHQLPYSLSYLPQVFPQQRIKLQRMVASGVKELLSIGCILRNYLHRSGSSDQHLRGLGVLLRFSCCDYRDSIFKVKAHQREAGAFMNECGKPINLFVTYRGQGTSPANSISQRKERALFVYGAPRSPSRFSKVTKN